MHSGQWPSHTAAIVHEGERVQIVRQDGDQVWGITQGGKQGWLFVDSFSDWKPPR